VNLSDASPVESNAKFGELDDFVTESRVRSVNLYNYLYSQEYLNILIYLIINRVTKM
jgi:hypothetical protein